MAGGGRDEELNRALRRAASRLRLPRNGCVFYCGGFLIDDAVDHILAALPVGLK